MPEWTEQNKVRDDEIVLQTTCRMLLYRFSAPVSVAMEPTCPPSNLHAQRRGDIEGEGFTRPPKQWIYRRKEIATGCMTAKGCLAR